MIEKIILDFLNLKLDVKVYLEIPNNPDEKYVIIEKTGSGESNHVKSATIAIQSYADSLYRAASLNEELKSTMEKAVELEQISKCKINSDYNYTDTSSKKYRYQAVYDITCF
ncbi:MAG: hypothetical protein PHT76_11505 [Anaerostipes sp.]|nr:hypothetical protein [Anaerostipes sp.]